ncbi:DctP family TRAP transporter solute-binding subunit [Halobacillus sp. Marseille-P3879]|uniref:DctP family TRAP transporter solute-binding subunit n=1 Tax=Halobacillus sp. Marseille-P3879 TaxID=2045014 RepID=UPI000C7E1898|nr:DctP family TRAP transporter solute-binding subunit [Halobacillus sp. Marseille-P3879]
MKNLLWSLVVVSCLMLTACGSSEDAGSEAQGSGSDEKVSFKLSTPDPEESNVTMAAKEFAEVVEEKSDGSIEISVHPNGTLYGGDPSAAVKQLGSGSLDMLVLSTSLYANFEPEFSAISVPYLFDDNEQYVSFLNGDLGNELLGSVSDLDIKGLGYWARDFRQITNSQHPIEEPADLDGLKLRVPNNPLWVEFFKGGGTATTPMDFGEVYNALQLGTIDGQENPLGVISSAKMHEVQDYLTISDHMADGWLVGLNQQKYDNLSDDQKQILEEATQEVQDWSIDYNAEQAESIIETLEEEGMEVNELSDEQKQEFIELSQEAYPAFEEVIEDEEFFEEVLKSVGKD